MKKKHLLARIDEIRSHLSYAISNEDTRLNVAFAYNEALYALAAEGVPCAPLTPAIVDAWLNGQSEAGTETAELIDAAPGTTIVINIGGRP